MKKIACLALFITCFFAMNASAHTKTSATVLSFSLADSAEYTGKYKYEGLPFDYMEVSLKEGKLFYSGGEYSGFLTPMPDKKDAFDASGQAVFTFLRDDKSKVVTLQIDYQGQIYTGKREEPKN